jgi:hypothetical protein
MNNLSFLEKARIKDYNRLIQLVKKFDFYAQPMCTDEYALTSLDHLFRGEVQFGRYDTYSNLNELQPAVTVDDMKKVFKLCILFKIPFDELSITTEKGTTEAKIVTAVKIYYKKKGKDGELKLFDTFHFNLLTKHECISGIFCVNYQLKCDSYDPVMRQGGKSAYDCGNDERTIFRS